MLKRAFDAITAFVLVVLCAPLLVILAILVKATSPGPVFYRGVRVGRSGKLFRTLKFRTMVENAEQLGAGTTSEKDPRVTKTGWFLRVTKLDELPQLFLVLKGDMSLVGPRPELIEHVADYTEEERMVILSVRPGITDYASIKYINLAEDVGEQDAHMYFIQHIRPIKNRLRMQYVQNQSFFEDLRIIWRTGVQMGKRILWNIKH